MSDAALTTEEQALFDQMQKDDGSTPPPEKTPEVKAEAAPPKVEEPPAPPKHEERKVVPAEALAEARSQNRELRKELDVLKSQISDKDSKLQQAVEAMTRKAEAPAPKFEDDPAANLKHENEQLKKGLEGLQKKIDAQENAGKHSAQVNAHAAAVAARESVFAKEHKDYYQAADFVAELWKDEFREAGFDEGEVSKLTFAKTLGVTTKAIQAGRDPATTVYNIAKRYGFAAKPAAEAEPKKEDGESKLKQIEKGLEAAKSAGGGSGPDADSGLAGLAQLDDAELERRVNDDSWWNKNIRRSPLH